MFSFRKILQERRTNRINAANPPNCSRCGRSVEQVARMILGPGFNLCDRCMDDWVDILREIDTENGKITCLVITASHIDPNLSNVVENAIIPALNSISAIPRLLSVSKMVGGLPQDFVQVLRRSQLLIFDASHADMLC